MNSGLRPEYTAAWLAWLAAFVVLEGLAVRADIQGNRGGTLSAHLRAGLGLKSGSHRVHRAVGIAGLFAAGSWFVPHLMSGEGHDDVC